MTAQKRERPRLKALKASAGVGTVGIEMVLSIVVGYFGGHWLDGRFDTTPYLSIVGVGFGVAAAVRAVVRAFREMQEITKREEEEQGNPRPMYGRDEPRADVPKDEDNGSPREGRDSDRGSDA